MLDGYRLFVDGAFRNHDPARPCILLIEQATNDLGNSAWPADLLYRTVTTPFVAAARAAGFYVALNTVLPRDDGAWNADKEAQRRRYNPMVRANGAGADVVNDIAGDVRIGDPAAGRRSYFPDGLHPDVAGQDRLG